MESNTNCNRYGGWPKVTGEKTGFFHTEKIGGRWWLIDPEGCAYIALAINHIKSDLLREPYNDYIFKTKYGTEEAFYRGVERDLKSWGFNALGTYNDEELCETVEMPFFHLFRFLNICGYYASYAFREEYAPLPYSYFPDIYSESWRNGCEEKIARECGRLKNEKRLIGYFFSDVPVWYQVDRWVDALLQVPGEAPGKKKYVEKMKERYKDDIDAWNRVYGTVYKRFEEIAENPFRRKSVNDRSAVLQDDEAFIRTVARDYYSFINSTIRKYDSNHLLLGDKYDGNAGIPPFVLEEAKEYIDGLAVQYYQIDPLEDHMSRIDYWQGLVDKPVLDTDSSFNVPKLKMPDPYGPHCATQYERGLRHKRYTEAFFGKPYAVGWLWCGYIDGLKGSGKPGTQEIHQHGGLKNEFDEPHTASTEIITQTNRNIYKTASGGSEER